MASPMKGMCINELVVEINRQRARVGLERITLNSRPSSLPGKTTIEVLTENGVLLTKSTHGGAINWFLKGMVTGFSNKPAPSVSKITSAQLGEFNRKINWKAAS